MSYILYEYTLWACTESSDSQVVSDATASLTQAMEMKKFKLPIMKFYTRRSWRTYAQTIYNIIFL